MALQQCMQLYTYVPMWLHGRSKWQHKYTTVQETICTVALLEKELSFDDVLKFQ